MLRIQPTIQRLAASKKPSMDASNDVDLQRQIVAQTAEQMAKRRAKRRTGRQKLKSYSLEIFENLEKIVLDLQSSSNISEAHAAILAAAHKKLTLQKK